MYTDILRCNAVIRADYAMPYTTGRTTVDCYYRGCGLCRPHQACPVAVNCATGNGQPAARPPASAPISCVRRKGLIDVACCTERVRLISRCQPCALSLVVHIIRSRARLVHGRSERSTLYSLRPTYEYIPEVCNRLYVI